MRPGRRCAFLRPYSCTPSHAQQRLVKFSIAEFTVILAPIIRIFLNYAGLGCLETAVFERPASQGAIGLESNIQALVPQYVFRCSGTVIEWQAYVVTGGPYSIEFQVWRPDPELENTYNRVGTNRFPDVANASKLLLLRVQQQQQRISVEPEDIVGFAVFSNRNESFELNVEENVYVLFEEIVDPRADRSSYELSYGSGSGYDPVLPHVHGAPLVNAVVRPDSGERISCN